MSSKCFYILFSITTIVAQSVLFPPDNYELKLLNNKNRCTRRYTPGVCVEENVSVWTFEFETMNCTERLGCPQAQRTNRFRSYFSCMSRCKPLVELYLQILSFGAENDTNFFLRDTAPKVRRLGPALTSESVNESLEDDASVDESVMTKVLYGDNTETEVEGDILQEDIDYTMAVRDQDDYFGFH